MKALILNSGLGHRMGDITKTHPKCMTEICEPDVNGFAETIISRQLRLIANAGITDVVITTGYFDKVLVDYVTQVNMAKGFNLNITFVNNPEYDVTNYIYSIYCARELLTDDDILLMHGDLVFEAEVLRGIIENPNSCMKISSTIPLPEKDFKAVVHDGRVSAVGVEFFDSAMEAQALYKMNRADWLVWLGGMEIFCEKDDRSVYAEKAFNIISNLIVVDAFDVQDHLCSEIDNPEDLAKVTQWLARILAENPQA